MAADPKPEGSTSNELQDTYLRAKRYLIFFSGALLLSVIAGINPKTDNSYLPVEVTRPEYWKVILFAAVLYQLAQLALFWDAQTQPAKALRQHLIDFWLSVAIALIAMGSLATFYLLTLPPLTVPNIFEDWAFVSSLLIGSLTALVPPIGIWFYSTIVRPKVKEQKIEEAQRAGVLADDLVSQPWTLVFNPASYAQTSGKRGSKLMSFSDGGTIELGRNDNEHRWLINGEFLELLDSAGEVFSRFRYDRNKRRFDHTNDTDTKSIKGQYLLAGMPVAPLTPSAGG